MRAATQLTRQYVAAGFVLVRWKKHLIWRCPCGHATLRSPTTPGKGHSIENCQGEIARTIKICTLNMSMKECA